jgi:hypothetical protein
MVMRFLEREKIAMPAAVKAALEQSTPADKNQHGEYSIVLGPILRDSWFEDALLARYYKPVTDFLKAPHGLWNEAEFPEQITRGSMTTFRAGISLALADALLQYGFLICVHVNKGCDSLIIGFSGYKNAESPLWLGGSSTKTQYAERFVHAHETICRIIDVAKEEGLLHECHDPSGFYGHRDWKKSTSFVNGETDFAWLMSGVIDEIVEKSGGKMEVISDPIKTSRNRLTFSPREDSDSAEDENP